MDHMFIMRLAALLFGGGIASCLFPGKSRMSHVLFLLLVLAETAVAHATIPDGWWFLLPGVVSVLLRLSFKGGTESGKGGKALLSLHATDGTIIRYYYWFSNFLVYGGAGSGKTKSIGKPLMEQYIRSGFAGFIYDFKDFDYTRTAYNLIRKHGYPHEFYYVNFTDMNRTYRFNPLDRRNIKDRTMLMQLMEDVLGALMPPTSKQDEWYTGALGILNGVAYRLWDEFPECCTLPHIVNFVMKADTGQLQEFLKLNDISAMMAGAYLKAEGSEKTQASYVSTLSNYVAKLATNENICYVLTGNDFDFNLIDPEHPKLFAISNNYYKALWRMTYDRLQEKGATQLLYAYSPGTEPKDSTEYLERYPGDDIVDLIGVDAYQFDKDAYVKSLDNALTIMSQVSKAHKKLMAVTETGYETIPDSLWWTQTLMPVIEKYPISYVLVWRNARERENHYYAPYPGHPSAADFVNFYNDPRTLFAGDMKTIK